MLAYLVILRDQLIGVGDILFEFLKRFALTKDPWYFLQLSNEPAIIFPEFKGKFMLHQQCLVKVAVFGPQRQAQPAPWSSLSDNEGCSKASGLRAS